ncbi:MAG: alpha-N-arabinofuranosidase [Propionibacteriaceae bacterium]|jgi:alpha-N-arabinofuranosidase|nr:alpha-N-arabinofuranosidase [Propionibacteriaceae bacterium]
MKATCIVDSDFIVGPVRSRTFGSFVEHLGRCVYTGLYEPDHPTATPEGFRSDVLDLVKQLGVTTIRYPGGNFVSGYQWTDGVGPVDQRPRRLDLAWHSTEPNKVGVDEFMAWARQAGVEPMMAVNLGTAGVDQALALLEYCNAPAGSYWADQRVANASVEPHRVKMWCLGNEMDGPWQMGHKTATEYGRAAAETARAMRMIDPGVELVVCGSSGVGMPTFGSWEHEVLSQTYDQVDMVSAHAYYFEEEGDRDSFLASAIDMDYFIDSVVATADAVKAATKQSKTIGISFDEWNVWYQHRAESRPPSGDDWPVAPVLLEDHYTVADAVVVGNLLMSLLRHTDRVYSASLAQLVNVIAPIMTETGGRAWTQTTFHPFALTARHAVGEVLKTAIDCPSHDTAKFGDTPLVDAVATRDPATGQMSVFLVNRSCEEAADVEIKLRGFDSAAIIEAITLSHVDSGWIASADDPSDQVLSVNTTPVVAQGRVCIKVPAVSWTLLRLATVAED